MTDQNLKEEAKYRQITQTIQQIHGDESAAEYIRWIIKSDTAKKYWMEKVSEECRDLLLRQLHHVTHQNGYPTEAVTKSTILSLPGLMKLKP